MSRDPAQWEIVLRELRNAGARGVHTFELRRMFIGNPSQRIAELEKKGYRISSTREKLHGKADGSRYVLVGGPDTPTRRPNPMPMDPPEGFAIYENERPRRSRLAIFDDEEAA